MVREDLEQTYRVRRAGSPRNGEDDRETSHRPVTTTMTRSGSPIAAGNPSVTPAALSAKRTGDFPTRAYAERTRAPSGPTASNGSGQSSTCTNTVSPRRVVAPQLLGATGPARVA